MSNKKRSTLLIVLMVSLFICACPGFALLIPGVNAFFDVLQTGSVVSQEDYIWNMVLSGGAILLALLAIAVPIILFVVWLFTRKSKDPYDQREPTGASADDPLPPTR